MPKTIAKGRLARQPSNTNKLLTNKFAFYLLDLPHVEYFTKQATLPGLSVDSLQVPTFLKDYPIAGTKLQYEQSFSLTFDVDEDLKNYLEIHDWLIGIGSPDNLSQYKALVEDKKYMKTESGRIWSDGRLIVHTQHFNKKFEIIFENMFPISLSDLTFDITQLEELQATVVFNYNKYRIEK